MFHESTGSNTTAKMQIQLNPRRISNEFHWRGSKPSPIITSQLKRNTFMYLLRWGPTHGSLRTAFRSQFSLSTTGVLGLELLLSDYSLYPPGQLLTGPLHNFWLYFRTMFAIVTHVIKWEQELKSTAYRTHAEFHSKLCQRLTNVSQGFKVWTLSFLSSPPFPFLPCSSCFICFFPLPLPLSPASLFFISSSSSFPFSLLSILPTAFCSLALLSLSPENSCGRTAGCLFEGHSPSLKALLPGTDVYFLFAYRMHVHEFLKFHFNTVVYHVTVMIMLGHHVSAKILDCVLIPYYYRTWRLLLILGSLQRKWVRAF